MQEVTKTHLPLLAWRWHENHYVLDYDDTAIGELTMDASGNSKAKYRETEWSIEPSSFHFKTGNGKGVEEGTIRFGSNRYRFLRNARKIPVRVTITGPEGQPLLQFSEEEPGRGRIQIDDQTAADSSDFDRLVLWGLHLYVTAPSEAKLPPLPARERLRAEEPAEVEMNTPDEMPQEAPEAAPAVTSRKGLGWIGWTLGVPLALLAIRRSRALAWASVLAGAGYLISQMSFKSKADETAEDNEDSPSSAEQ